MIFDRALAVIELVKDLNHTLGLDVRNSSEHALSWNSRSVKFSCAKDNLRVFKNTHCT